MSAENFKNFVQRAADDEQVRSRLKEIGIINIEEVIDYGKQLGFEFNVDDMKAVAEEAGLLDEELTEEQLEQIAAGISTTTAIVLVLGLIEVATLAGSVANMAKGW